MGFLTVLLGGVLRLSLSLGLLSSCLSERECHLGLSWDGLEGRGLWTLDLRAHKDASLRVWSNLGCALAVALAVARLSRGQKDGTPHLPHLCDTCHPLQQPLRGGGGAAAWRSAGPCLSRRLAP